MLDGTIDDRSQPEYVSPIVQHQSSPSLSASVNTRLSPARGTCTRSPAFASFSGSVVGTNETCFGIVPAAAGASAVGFFRFGNQQIRQLATGYQSSLLRSVRSPGNPQTAYHPVKIENAGGVPNAPAQSNIASAYNSNTGHIWFAYTSPTDATSANVDLFVYAMDEFGNALCAPTLVVTFGLTANTNVCITSHFSNGMRVWWQDSGIKIANVTISGNLVSVSAPISVYTSTREFTAATWDSNTAAVACGATTTAAARVMMVNVNTGAIVTFDTPGGGPVIDTAAITVATLYGTTYIAAAFAVAAGALTKLYTYAGTTLTAVWTQTATASASAQPRRVAVQFQGFLQAAVVVASSDESGSFSASAAGTLGTMIHYLDLSVGTVFGTHVLPWRVLMDRGATLYYGENQQSAVFNLGRAYAAPALGADDPSSPNYCDDPSIESYRCRDSFTPPAPVARFGVVRGQIAPARVVNEQALGTCALIGPPGGASRIVTCYRKANYQIAPGYPNGAFYGRWVLLAFEGQQPAVAHDKDGSAMAAAALPIQWDGVEVVELGGPSLHAPKIAGVLTGGSGPVLAAGVYSYRAMYQFTDATGATRRSRPSNIVTITTTGAGTDKPVLRVTMPDSMRNGVQTGAVSILLYGTVANGGADFHLSTDLPTAADAYQVTFGAINPVDLAGQQIFSVTGAGGEELFPHPAPPLWDVVVIGSRAYGIDAEYRSRLVCTKLRVSGVGFEWAPALEVPFPGGAGKLMSVREWQGLPVVLTERGVYSISGAGPNNTGAGGDFGPPNRVGEIGCTSRDSVIVTPNGILWQFADWFVRLDGSGVSYVPNIRVYATVTGALMMRAQDEAVFFTNQAKAWVYNFARDRWTTWEEGTYANAITNVVSLPSTMLDSLVYSTAGGRMLRITHASVGTAPSMIWRTDWIQLGGDWQDSVILRWIVVKGRSLSTHDLTVSVFTNFDDGTPRPAITWSTAELATLQDGVGRFSLKMEPTEQNTRAVKLIISDLLTGTAGGGFQPSAITVVWALDDGLLREETFAVSQNSIR